MISCRMFFCRNLALLLALVLQVSLSRAEDEAPQTDFTPVIELPAPALESIRAEIPPARPAMLREQEALPASAKPVALTMLLDETGLLDIKSIQEHRSEFVPLQTLNLRRSGALWLALSLADAAPFFSNFWLDLGLQIPRGTKAWEVSGGDEQALEPALPGLYLLRNTNGNAEVFIRLGDLPGLWFQPMLRPLKDFGDSPERIAHGSLLTALALLSVFCLLLSITGQKESFWTAILATATLLQTAWGAPVIASGQTAMGILPGVLATGVALVMLPHQGRTLMNTHRTSPFLDIIFLLLALCGACVSALPLLPGWRFTARFLPLWPVMGALCLIPAFLLLLRGVRGSVSFVLACLFFGGGVAVALFGLFHGAKEALWEQALPCGTVLGILCLLFSTPHRIDTTDKGRTTNLPTLELSPLEETEKKNSASAKEAEAALRELAGELLAESCQLNQALGRIDASPETVDVMTHADGMVAVSRRMMEVAGGKLLSSALPPHSEQNFDLREVIQRVFASVADEADSKGLGLAWYVAPHLKRNYRGDSVRLTTFLSLLLRDAVRSSKHGAVRLEVRRSPTSTHPGHLLFTVSDNGEGRPPHGRNSLLLSGVWELATECGGDFFVDVASQGMDLSFSMEFTPLDAGRPAVRESSFKDSSAFPCPDGRLVILSAADGLCRQLCAHYLDGLGYRLREARDGSETLLLYTSSPAGLLLFDGSLGEEDMARTLASIRIFEGEHSLPAAPFLLLARNEEQAERMTKAGFEEALMQPVLRKDLRLLAEWLISGRRSSRPTTQRISPSGTGTVQPRRASLFISRSDTASRERGVQSTPVELRRENIVFTGGEVLDLEGDQIVAEASDIRELTEKEVLSTAPSTLAHAQEER